VNAIQSAKRPQGFLGVSQAGRTAVLRSRGNGCGHLVLHDVVPRILEGNRSVAGLMLESNLFAGNQPIPEDLSKLRHAVSVTDACIDWPTTG
jgi:3-deoxy-D-arabino-heptulosonate 7-phosphate (DAHP) synthase